MKRPYWLVVIFGLWCAGSAIWYMFAVQGLSHDLNYFKPLPILLAIAEILIMLLIACLIGYAIGWTLRKTTIESLQDVIQRSEQHASALTNAKLQSEEKLARIKRQLEVVTFQNNDEATKFKAARRALETELSDIQQQLVRTQEEEKKNDALLGHLETDNQAWRSKSSELESKVGECVAEIKKLKSELERAQLTTKARIETTHPFVRQMNEDDKDDLTAIKGIGPFIEKRLNMVGIYTYQQISEFTPDMIEQVTKAIEFFPNRMTKDDWIGQAKRLLAR